jgi:hypothetical protein
MRLHHGSTFLALLVLGCAAADPPAARAPMGGPSADDLHLAMAMSLPHDMDGETVSWSCPRVTQHQCWPIGKGRFRCTYVERPIPGARGHTARRTPLVERLEDGSWLWIRGKTQCNGLM